MSSLPIAYFQNPVGILIPVSLSAQIKLNYRSNNIIKLWGLPLQEQDMAFYIFESLFHEIAYLDLWISSYFVGKLSVFPKWLSLTHSKMNVLFSSSFASFKHIQSCILFYSLPHQFLICYS